MNDQDPFAEMRRELERMFGYSPVAFDPWSTFLTDSQRINRALGEGFVMLQDILGPQQILDRIEAALDFPAGREILELPRRMWEIRPPWPNKG